MNAQPDATLTPRAASLLPAGDRAGGAERQLLAAVERIVRYPQGRVALVLHLSGLMPPAPRPHHLRVARAMLHDVAQRHDGQTFALRNGDVVLLCQAAVPAGGAPSLLVPLPATLARLFRRDAPDPSALISLWPLPHEAERLLGYAAARLAGHDAGAPTEDAAAPVPDAITTLDALIGRARPTDLIHRQTAVLLAAPPPSPGSAGRRSGAGASEQLRPLYQELSVSMELLEAHLEPPAQISRDPCLMQHFAGRLDGRLLRALREETGSLGPLDPGGGGGGRLPLHLNITLAGLLSDEFAALAAGCRAGGRTLAAEVQLVEAGADPAGFSRGRERAAQLGVALVLDGVSHLALQLGCPWLLGADLIKLAWSPRLPDLPAGEQAELDAAIRMAEPARLVLHRADTEAALRWGLAHGIRRFQGRHTEAMLAATRIIACPVSGACNLRQCAERASATGGAGRASCGNLALLDAGSPAPAGAAA